MKEIRLRRLGPQSRSSLLCIRPVDVRIRPEDLSRRLSRGALAPVYFVFGSEPLQIEESLDAIRSSARAQGHDERVVLHADTVFDWSELRQYRDSLSLFAEKRLVDLRLVPPQARAERAPRPCSNTPSAPTRTACCY